MAIVQMIKGLIFLFLLIIFALLTLILTLLVFFTAMNFFIKVILFAAVTATIYFMVEICQDAMKVLYYDDHHPV